MDLNRISADLSEPLAELFAALGEGAAAYLAGREEHDDNAATYGRFPELLTSATLAEIRAGVQRGNGALRPVLAALVRIQIEAGCAPLRNRLQRELDRESVRTLDGKWPFCKADEHTERECDRKTRKLLDQSRRRLIARSDALFQALEIQAHTLMVDRGFGNYLSMCGEISGVDLAAFFDEAQGFLEDTAAHYRALLAVALREAGVFPEDARRHDVLYLFAGHYGPAKPLPNPFPALEETFAGMGLTLSVPGVSVDIGSREELRPGIRTVTLSVPDRIVLLGHWTGGWHQWPLLLGEAGKAVAFAATPPGLPFSQRQLPAPELVTAFSTVFAGLYGNPAWLARFAPEVEARPQVQRYHLWWLFTLRQLAGNARYARFLHGPGELSDKADPYEAYMHEAVGMRMERENYLFETPWFFDQALAFRGHMFGAQLSAVLEDRFGGAWFEDPEAGAFLKSLWALGWDDPARIATVCGINDPANVWPAVERLETVLGEFVS